MSYVKIGIQSIADAAAGRALFPEYGALPRIMGEVEHAAILEGGMQSGKASVTLAAVIDGKLVALEISADMFRGVHGALVGAEARWASNPRRGLPS